MKKMTGESTNITEENLSAMRQLFPEAFEEGKIDFDVLRQLLGDYVDDEEERYSFKWNGKGRALRLSQTPSTGTLRPCKEESVDWDTTQNLYIEGDNLEVLKLLQKSYHGRVKMIYIDPPYNTGSDFVYKDDFRDNVENYKRITGQVDGEGHWISANKEHRESSGRFHTDWLNMMYPRLRLARNLLADDGVIFISIDDNELDNLKKLCDEVFGEGNFTATFLWTKTNTPPALSYKSRKTVEYVLAYEKSLSQIKYYGNSIDGGDAPLLNTGNTERILTFPVGSIQVRFMESGMVTAGIKDKVELLDDLYVEKGINANVVRILGAFKWKQETLEDELKNGTYAIIKTSKFSVRFQRIYTENTYKTPTNFLDIELNRSLDIGTNETAKQDLEQLGLGEYFEYTKPFSLIQSLNEMICKYDNNALVLDFFSGSATTAHAVMQMNAEDGGNRRFIMVQLPEPTPETSEAAKAGYANICEIGKERIRRAGEKVKAECADAERAAALDVGFKVFKLDSSNLQKWQPQPEDLMASLEASMDNFLPDRTALDVVYEIALKLGLDLSYEVEKRKVDDHTVCVIGAGALMICLDSQISMDTAEALLRLHEEYEPEAWQVVFRDTGFLSDQEKTNIKETLKSAGLDEDAFISI